MSESISTFSNLIAALQNLRNDQETGIVFLVSGDNRSAQVSFENGNIVQALCQGKKGERALEIIAQMEKVRFRFQAGAIPPSRAAMPVFEEVIRSLENATVVPVSGKRPMTVGKPSSLKFPDQALTEDQKKILHDSLVECIGPMATILCEDHFGTARSMEEAIEAIVDEISPAHASRFRSEVQRKVL